MREWGLSSRIHAGYADTPPNPEPYAGVGRKSCVSGRSDEEEGSMNSAAERDG